MIEVLITGAIVGSIWHAVKRDIQRQKLRDEENLRRRNMPCCFPNNMTKEQFESLVYKVSRRFKRISNISVDGVVIYGTVQSQSGYSEWDFILDFNNYGKYTGAYWIDSDNDDSNIPDHLAENIIEAINNDSVKRTSEGQSRKKRVKISTDTLIHCPKCDSILNYQKGFESWKVAFTCTYCGTYCEWASGYLTSDYKINNYGAQTNTNETNTVPIYKDGEAFLYICILVILLVLLAIIFSEI